MSNLDGNTDTDAGMQRRIRHALAGRFDERVAREAELQKRGGHASLRIYWRVGLPAPGRAGSYPRGDRTLYALALPHPGRVPGDGENVPSTLRDAADAWPFVNVQRYLRRIGLAVPGVDHADLERGVLLIEDLGDETFEQAVLHAAGIDPASGAADPAGPLAGEAVAALYREVLDIVLHLQESARRSQRDSSFGEAFACISFERAFERDLLRWELDHYLEWGLEARRDGSFPAARRAPFEAAFDRLTDELLALPRTLALRDLQSRNLMRKAGRWYLIDFQDALLGPFVYDLVALLRDSYVLLDDDLVFDLLYYYTEKGRRIGLPWCEEASEVRRAFHLQTVQRKLKDAGRFVFIKRQKGDDSFLPYYAPSIRYVEHALAHLPAFEDLREALRAAEPAFKKG